MKEIKNSVEHLKNLAIGKLIAFFENKGIEDEDTTEEAKMAMGTLKAVGVLLATNRVKEATQFAIIKAITTDVKVREQYIKATLPQYVPSKLLK